MPANDTELFSVYWANGGEFQVGRNECMKIVLKTDGHGPMGYYDRIHVFVDGHPPSVFPAHNAEGWQEAGGRLHDR